MGDRRKEYENRLLGYCRECGAEVFEKDEIAPKVYECNCCDYPSSEIQLWDSVPYYIKQPGIRRDCMDQYFADWYSEED